MIRREDARLRGMYVGGHGNVTARRYVKAWNGVFRLGLLPRRWVTLEVAGRQTGKTRRFPLGMADVDGTWYLVSMLGECAWVWNVRAADGWARLRRNRTRPVHLVEIPPSQRARILKRYVQKVPGGRPHVPVDRRAPEAAFATVAADYPVFRVDPVPGSGTREPEMRGPRARLHQVGTAYDHAVNEVSATRPGSWLVRHVAARVDPILYRRTGGRVVLSGRPTLPMLTLTTPGRRTGRPRSVQLAYVEDGADLLVVASAMGQEDHPEWRHNLEAAGRATVQLQGRQVEVTARALRPAEAQAIWPRVVEAIPQMSTYVSRTDRQFRIFRLTPA